MRKIFTAIFLLSYLVGFSQGKEDSIENRLSKNIEVLMIEAKKGNPHFYDRELIIPISNHPELAYSLLKKYEKDSNQHVLYAVASNYKWLKGIINNVQIRQNLTYNLLQLYKQFTYSSNSFYNTIDIPADLSDPERSKASDFNADAKELLVELLQDSLINKHILKVVGIAKMQDQIPELRKFLPEGKHYRKPSNGRLYFLSWEWYARLVMARLGDQKQIDYCVEKIESSEEEIMSNHHAAGDYFDDLVYIKQPKVLPFLFEMLIPSNEFAGDPIYTTTYYAANALYKLLEEFPHDPDVVKYSEKSLKKLEKWVRENKGKYEFKQ